MMYTLQKYILKELLRSFILTAVALTCLLGFGGGVRDMLRIQGITAHEMIKLMMYLIPVVLAYSLPVAALFATTITYGRLSSDNEINACRASGINILKLLLPAGLLSLVVTATTFTLENYTIPDLALRIEQMLKRDIQTWAYLRLKNQGFISQFEYAFHCDQARIVELPKQQPDGTYTAGQVELSKVAFLRHQRDIPVFYGTAKKALIVFDTYGNTPSVSIHLNQVRAFNEERGEMIQADYYPIGPVEIPSMAKQKIKFLSLPDLLSIMEDPFQDGRTDPYKYTELAKVRRSVYAVLKRSMVYDDLVKQYSNNNYTCRLKDSKGSYTITAESLRQNPKDGRIIMEGNVVMFSQPVGGKATKFMAKEATLQVASVTDDSRPVINIEFKDVKVTEDREGAAARYTNHTRLALDPIDPPPEVLAAAGIDRVKVEDLIAPNAPYNSFEFLRKKRAELAIEIRGALGKCVSEIHSRLAYSFSALVLLTLGACLGIIFRGGHFVSAFGLSFIPMLIVVMLIMTGKQFTASGMTSLGVPVIWSGLAVVALANLIVVTRFLRR